MPSVQYSTALSNLELLHHKLRQTTGGNKRTKSAQSRNGWRAKVSVPCRCAWVSAHASEYAVMAAGENPWGGGTMLTTLFASASLMFLQHRQPLQTGNSGLGHGSCSFLVRAWLDCFSPGMAPLPF